MAIEPKRRLFSVEDYHLMGSAGILNEDDRVELIAGEIVEMTPIGGEHIGCTTRLTMLFARGLEGALVQVQSPIRLDESNEPQPDLVVLHGSTRVFPASPKDVLLVIEVADTSLRYDQTVKLPLYAGAGIPEVWIAEVGAKSIVVYRDPADDRYQTIWTVRGDASVSPQEFPELNISPSQVFD